MIKPISHAKPHQREAVQVLRVRQGFCSKQQPGSTHANAHRRKAVQVLRVRQGIYE